MPHLLARLRDRFFGPPDDSVVIADYVRDVSGYAMREGSMPVTVASLTRYLLLDLSTDAIRAMLTAYAIKLEATSFEVASAELSSETDKVSSDVVDIVSRAHFTAKGSGRDAPCIDPADVLVSLAMHPSGVAILERLGLTRLKITYFLSHGRALPAAPDDELHELPERPTEVFVCIKNDDHTPMASVTQVLEEIFEIPAEQAPATMLMIHEHEQAYLGPYTYDDARSKAARAITLMRQAGEPLLITLARDNTISWAEAWREGKHRRLRRMSAKQGRPVGFIRKHWRGDRNFAASFWLVGVLGTVVLGFVCAVSLSKSMLYLEPSAAVKFSVVLWIVAAVILTWQWKGVWRAARRYKTNRWRTYLGNFAQVGMAAVVIGVVGMGLRVMPHVQNINRLSGDADFVPSYAVVLEGRDTIVFSGGFRFGAARALNRVLEANPSVRIVRLHSPGGRGVEGALMRDVIEERGLITHVRETCASACTAAFLGGSRRYLSKGGHLTFHRSRHGQRPDAPESSYSVRFQMGRAGIAQPFIDRVANTPATSEWTPTHAELLAAGVVHEIGEPGQVAGLE